MSNQNQNCANMIANSCVMTRDMRCGYGSDNNSSDSDGCDLWTRGKGPRFVRQVGGEYHVHEKAKNKGNEWRTIQKAIDAALADGYTPASGKTASVIIHNKDTPHRGDPINNEINVPISVNLVGEPTQSGVVTHPQVEATIKVTNAGIAPGTTAFLPNIFYNISGLNLIKPSGDKPVLEITTDASSQFFIYLLTNSYVTNSFFTNTSPTIVLKDFSFFYSLNSVFIDSSGDQPLILTDAGTVEFFFCNIVGFKLVKSTGIGAVIPGTDLVLYFCDIIVESAFLGGVDTEVRLFEFESLGLAKVFISQSAFTYLGITTFTKGSRILDVRNLPPNSIDITFLTNSYDLEVMASGTQLIYDAPTQTINSGNYARSNGVTASNVGTLQLATIV